MRKQCKRKHLIPTVNPMVYKLEPSAAQTGKVTAWRTELARIINTLKDGTFGHTEAKELHEYITTCFVVARMAKRDDVYDYVGKAANPFLSMLARRQKIDRWSATGDEIKALLVVMDDLAVALGELPESTIRAAMARADAETVAVARQMAREARRAA